MTEQEFYTAMAQLETELKEVQATTRNNGINFFKAAGLSTQEVKHSAFLSWLLSPNEVHELKDVVIRKLLERLYDYVTKQNNAQFCSLSNKDILCNIGIKSKAQLTSLVKDKVFVVTEEVSGTNSSRTDILIDIPGTNTIIVIENKVGAQVGRDQLRKYEATLNDVTSEYYSYSNKIYIFLTKNGELPINIGGDGCYNDKWCAFDYEGIAEIIEEIIAEVSEKRIQVKEITKLKTILEDYKDMIYSDVLQKSSLLRSKCTEISSNKQLKAALDLINTYNSTYATYENVLDFCKTWLKNNVPNIVIYNENKKSFCCCTDAMEKYFLLKGETNYQSGWRCLCGTSSNDEMVGYFQLYKASANNWDPLQNLFLTKQDITASSSQATVEKSVLISSVSDRDKPLGDIEQDIEKSLKIFVRRMMSFEKKLLTT